MVKLNEQLSGSRFVAILVSCQEQTLRFSTVEVPAGEDSMLRARQLAENVARSERSHLASLVPISDFLRIAHACVDREADHTENFRVTSEARLRGEGRQQ